jgi:hypothetical protein
MIDDSENREPDVLEKLAEAAHRAFCAGKVRDGWKYGPVRDNEQKLHPLLVDFAALPEEYKESNRRTVRDIPKKLARAGYVMVAGQPGDPPLEFTDDEVELLAQYEHKLWMDAQRAAGFELGTPTSDDPLRNVNLVPWDEVDEKIRQIDRDLVRAIPQILREADYTAIRI